MKYIILLIFLLAAIAGQAQNTEGIYLPNGTVSDSTIKWWREHGKPLQTGFAGTNLKIQSGNTVFEDIVLLLQQNKDLSDRLDRLETTMDSLKRDPTQFWGINKFNTRYNIEMYDSLTARIDSLERRPYLFMDYRSKPFPQLVARCPDGSCEYIIECFK